MVQKQTYPDTTEKDRVDVTVAPLDDVRNEDAPEGQKKAGRLMHWHMLTVLIMFLDFFAIHAAYMIALWGRFDFAFSRIPDRFFVPYRSFITVYSVVCLLVFWVAGLYRIIWRFISYRDLIRIFFVSLLMSVIHSGAITLLSFFQGYGRMPFSYYLWGMLLQFIFLAGIRFSYRLFLFSRHIWGKKSGTGARVMLIGAGAAGRLILRDMVTSDETNDRVVCFIDDNPNKQGRYIDGVLVAGGRDDILNMAVKYKVDKIYLAIPSASNETRRDILNICKATNCRLKQLPGVYQFVTGELKASAMKDVEVEDLLGRAPIKPDLQDVFEFIRGKTVLVTGGGGSIGSELCRQVARHSPKQLIIFDVYENNAYDIQLELLDRYPDLNLEVLIGSVRDSRRMYDVFQTYHPQIVYHAAAHKHVPLMEVSPCEAVKNNAIGTYKTAYAAMVNGCERFVLISTDKAVNPTNVMGASKRLCEMIIQSFDRKIKEGKASEIPQIFTHVGEENADKDGTGSVYRNIRTEFVAVRFGNVLGSNGSVVPVFKRQIAKGGPVTVTHPDIIRYFMTIPEAVSLVLLAGTYAHGGEIFVLDMGSQMKIVDLAKNLIKLSGFKPGSDIMISYSGLRPGEKLYEEKLMAEEGLKTTKNELIYIGQPIPFDIEEFLQKLESLMYAAYSNRKDIVQILEDIVPTYDPDGKKKKAREEAERKAVEQAAEQSEQQTAEQGEQQFAEKTEPKPLQKV